MGISAKPHTDRDGIIGKELQQVKQQLHEKTRIAPSENPAGKILDCKNLFEGKMLRPKLVLLSAKLSNPFRDDNCNPLTVKTATAMELLHNATLLHDDVIDRGKTRRGNRTLNSLKGNQTAVLAGDFLLTRVFGMCSGFPSSVTKIIAQAASKTCTGEITQIARTGDRELSEEEYLRIITDKTAALFAACCHLGAVTERGDTEIRKKLNEIGENIGIAYQLADDLLDITGTEESEGKTLGTDTANNKLTLPVIHFLKNSNKKQRKAFLDNLENNPEQNKFMVNELSNSKSLAYTRGKVCSYIEKAINGLNSLRGCPAGKEIKKICLQIRGKAEQTSRTPN